MDRESQSAALTTVRIASGTVAGTGTDVRVFRGVPYAAPPVGPLRWRPPQPVEPWRGVHDGSRFGNDPMQAVHPLPIRRSLAPGMSEDCLNLNIWVPSDVPAAGAPVIVNFEGGQYIGGTASRQRIDGLAYARRGVAFVAVNYRVGAFGFLAHPALTAESPQHSSGNYGLLDMIAALRWVRENIGAFGGDPTRITAAGGSAGAALCAILLTSPLAAGLIDRVILRNLSFLRPMPDLALAEAAGRVVGGDLATMRAMPAEELLAMNARINPPERNLSFVRVLRSIVDGWVIERDEIGALRSGAFLPVPTIVGNCVNEGATLTADAPTYSVPPAHDSIALQVTTTAQLRDFLAENFGPAFDEAWTYYGASADGAVWTSLAALWGDARFLYGLRGLARAMAKRQPKTFRYVFTHAGAHTSDPPAHGNDTTYVFGTGDFAARDRAVSDAIVAAFANFAAGGDPNGPGAPAWAPYDPARDNELALGGDFGEITHRRAASLDFLERFYATASV